MNKKGQEMALSVGLIIFIVVFIGVLIVFFLGYDTVQPSHMGVMVRFGNILGTMDPGMKWTGLFTDVFSYDLRTRKAEIALEGDNYSPSKDGQKIFAVINVNYRVKRDKATVSDLYANIGPDDIISDRLNIPAIITEGFKQATVGYTAMEILEKRQEVKEKAVENIKKNFPEHYFEIENIIVTNIAFSPAFADEIEKKQIALQTALKEQNNLETVKFQQQQVIEQAKAESERIRLQSAALTQLTINQKLLDTWDGHLPSTLIITPESNGLFLQLAKGEVDNSLVNP
jgi:prohibitin 2